MQEDQLQEGRGNNLFTLKNFLILAIGFILSYLIKIQVAPRITMGYDDYKLSQWQSNVAQDEVDSVDANNNQAVQSSEKNNQ